MTSRFFSRFASRNYKVLPNGEQFGHRRVIRERLHDLLDRHEWDAVIGPDSFSATQQRRSLNHFIDDEPTAYLRPTSLGEAYRQTIASLAQRQSGDA